MPEVTRMKIPSIADIRALLRKLGRDPAPGCECPVEAGPTPEGGAEELAFHEEQS